MAVSTYIPHIMTQREIECMMQPGVMTPKDAPGGASPTQEVDPNGLDAKQPGAKLDAGKAPVARGALHYFPRAIAAVSVLSSIGAKKYTWKGWQDVPDGVNRYGDAAARHEGHLDVGFHARDPDTGVLELTAVAWNDLARLEIYLREHPEEKA
jgi:hypothetical protein